jgi:hypothetical protein
MNRNFTSVTKQYGLDNTTHTGYETVENGITRSVPLDPANTDYQAIQEWILKETLLLITEEIVNGIYIKSRHDPGSKRQ